MALNPRAFFDPNPIARPNPAWATRNNPADRTTRPAHTGGGLAADQAGSATAKSEMAAGDTTTADTGIERIANEVGLSNTDMMNTCTLVATFRSDPGKTEIRRHPCAPSPVT